MLNKSVAEFHYIWLLSPSPMWTKMLGIAVCAVSNSFHFVREEISGKANSAIWDCLPCH